MIYEIDEDDKNGLNNTTKNMEQSLKLESDQILQESNIEKKQMEARQRVFNQSPEYKKREIVFGQIQRINNRLSSLEGKVDEILAILKATD
ncbi:MAG TPA: hypothetical protein VFT71_03805 [Candidatus Nitrosocosmicus sp.]|nr:hypothetical protein [Candidatus Nitrosocosmicus sp.]